MRRKQRHTGPGNLLLILDADEIYPDDPGNGTPAMLHLARRRSGEPRSVQCSSTYWCAAGEGEVEEHRLTPAQNSWLMNEAWGKVDAFMAAFPNG